HVASFGEPSPDSSIFFFFQAEDGIRDLYVTGVQTCALPILAIARSCRALPLAEQAHEELIATGARPRKIVRAGAEALTASERREIGRASCRERGEDEVVDVRLNRIEGRRRADV